MRLDSLLISASLVFFALQREQRKWYFFLMVKKKFNKSDFLKYDLSPNQQNIKKHRLIFFLLSFGVQVGPATELANLCRMGMNVDEQTSAADLGVLVHLAKMCGVGESEETRRQGFRTIAAITLNNPVAGHKAAKTREVADVSRGAKREFRISILLFIYLFLGSQVVCFTKIFNLFLQALVVTLNDASLAGSRIWNECSAVAANVVIDKLLTDAEASVWREEVLTAALAAISNPDCGVR
jgi:hypothetical protein